MLRKLIFQVISGILGLYFAIRFINGVGPAETVNSILIVGTILGLVNFFVKPFLKAISLPLRIVTFGLFSLVINMVLIWLVVDVLSSIEIQGLIPLFWTTIIIWFLNMIFEVYRPKKLMNSNE